MRFNLEWLAQRNKDIIDIYESGNPMRLLFLPTSKDTWPHKRVVMCGIIGPLARQLGSAGDRLIFVDGYWREEQR